MGIQVVGHTSFLGHTGYNNHSKNFFTHLNKYIPVRIRNYSYVDDLSYLKPEEKKLLIQQDWNDPPYKIGRPFKPNSKDILVNLVLNETNHYFFYDHYDHPMIAYNVWEATRQPPDYFKRVLEYDQFWCPTEWQRQCTIDQGYPADRVKVVPEGVNGKVFCPSSNPGSIRNKLYKKYNIPRNKFSFMLFGRWDYRKSITEVIQAFLEEFKNDDNVVLIASVDNPFSVDGLKTTEERLKHHNMESDKIKILHFPDRSEYIEWMQSGDVFLCCPRSEGWNLPLLEAIASGTPSICSDWGAHLEFADGIAYKVNVPTEKSPDHVFNIKPGQELGMWGEPDFDHLKKVMRNVYNDYSRAKQFAFKASKDVREKFSWGSAARIAETYIQELAAPYMIQVPGEVKKQLVRYFDIAPSFDGLELEILLNNIFPELEIENYEVYAFEPCQESFDMVTTKFSDYKNIKFEKLAIWKKEGNLKLYHSPDNPHGNSLFDSKFNVAHDVYENVNTIRFSKWLSKNVSDLDKSFNILRYNIEGSELELFRDLDKNDLFKHFNIITGIGSEDLKKCGELLDEVDEFDSIRKKHNINAPNFDPDNWEAIKYIIQKEYTDSEFSTLVQEKQFNVEFGRTDEGNIKITFKPLKNFDRVLARMRNSFGEILYQSWFKNLQPDISYWLSANHSEDNLKSLTFELLDDKTIIIQSNKKEYIRKPPKVSLVTSFFNAEEYIDELADSVFDQTYKEWEWIITDDWSKDKTKEKLINLAKKDIRIKYINQKFKQEIYWNPHKYASGEIICNIDADDALIPKTVEVLVHFYNKFPKVNCIHTSGNYYLENFEGINSFKNPSYCRMDKYNSILQKHIPYLENKNGYERLGQMFGVIRSYRNPGSDFNFNDANYQLGKHEDLVKLLRLEEMGTPMYLNRTLYKVRLRETGSNSGNWKDYGGDNEFDIIRDDSDKRRKKSFKHLTNYDSIREKLYSFLYSKLNDERDRKTICCLGFDLDINGQKLIKETYFDHNILFEEVNINTDYVFIITKTQNDVELYYKMTSNLKKCQIIFFFINDDWTPDFYKLSHTKEYFKVFEASKNWLADQTSFEWTTYLYKYCSIIYNIDIYDDLSNLPFKSKTIPEMELYQDQYVNGSVIVKGKRECNSRYEAMKRVFEKYNRPFTILDIGANFGYYSIRACTEYDATAIMVESEDNEIKTLLKLCEQNSCKDKLTILQTRLDFHKLKEISKCEHFDVVLALNIIHHFKNEELSEVCETFTKLGDNLILETPPIEDSGACGQNNLKDILNYFNSIVRTNLGKFKRHTSDTMSQMFWFKTPKSILEWPYYEYEKLFSNIGVDVKGLKNRGVDGAKTIVESDFDLKKVISPKKEEILDWIPGINLKTFIKLNGVYPSIYNLIKKLKMQDIRSDYKWDDSNSDLMTHNIILNGNILYLIDFNDKLVDTGIYGDELQIKRIIYELIKSYHKPKEDKIKLNLGCGNDIKDGYINIDRYNNTGNVDMSADIGKLPFDNESVDEIYTSHVFEHIPINEIYEVVEEWKRVLKPNGDLILRLPNLEHEVNIWLNTPDEDKWTEVYRIFGAQSHPGNTHFCGFNLGSLSSFIESFDFEIVYVRDQNRGHGNEIGLHAKKKEDSRKTNANYTCHFVDGPFINIQGEKTNNYFVVDFLDPEANASVHQQLLKVNSWTRPHRKYYTDWLVQVRRNGKLDFEHCFDLKNKNVLISFDTKGIGDTIAWIPYIEEFRNKHNCNVWISTFWNKLFKGHKNYSKLNFVHPGKVVENLYASYSVGCYDGDMNKNKINWRLLPLQKVCSDTLGLDYKEIVPDINFKSRGRRIKEKYVTISEFSTFQCKFWNYPGAWQEIVDYLNELGLKVMVISKEKTKLKNIINRTDRTIEESMNNIYHSEFCMGVSSGPAWLAWALKVPVIMISGYSKALGEFHTGVKRVINTNVCHGCFNRTDLPFDRGDWNWCPVHKGTPRQFECTKQITPDMVKEAIGEIIKEREIL